MRQRITWAFAAAIVVAAAWAGTLRATPASGFSGKTLWTGHFAAMHLKNQVRQYDWESELETEGSSDLFVQSNTWAAVGDPNFPDGGSTGWHTHPGFSLIMVTAGTVTVYDGDDPSCTPHYYSQGSSFVDPGGGHVHLIRNDGKEVAQTVAVQLIPTAAGAAGRRIDAPAPGNCGF
jgi:hypothetical protein